MGGRVVTRFAIESLCEVAVYAAILVAAWKFAHRHRPMARRVGHRVSHPHE
jgi:hypothetical protein